MSVSYKKLFHKLIEENITSKELQEKAGFSGNIMTRLRRNQYISLESVEKICETLNCDVDEILDFSYKEDVRDGR